MSAAAGTDLIAAERKRQIDKLGYDAKHDAGHDTGEIAIAAACYVVAAVNKENRHQHAVIEVDGELTMRVVKFLVGEDAWPWPEADNRKKHDAVRALVIAGALIAAEIDRRLAKGEK